jgi:hypothetical protein
MQPFPPTLFLLWMFLLLCGTQENVIVLASTAGLFGLLEYSTLEVLNRTGQIVTY